MRVLEVSLRKAGFTVTSAVSVQDALDKLELDAPDLIISETVFPDGDGFELRRRVRATPEWGEIPFIFLTAEAAIENKIRGLELGVDDYLTKPIYIKEIVTRINILLQKRQRVRFEERRDGRTRFAGRVADMPVVDVIQTIEISRKSGVIQFVGDRGRQAAIYFRDGRVIDAEAGALQGEDAVYRLLTWSEGEFEVVFRTVRRREAIATSSQGLLMEGMRRLDEWSRLLEQLPALTHRFEVDAGELSARLGDVPDDNNSILRLIDGKRTLLEVIDASDVGDLECLQAISKLYFEEMLIDLDHGSPTRRDTGKPMPLVEVDAPTPIEEVASGPIEVAVDDREVIEEEPAPGALMGGYRHSSLMLIDAAVAAAQAIEPSLFDGEVDAEVDALMNAPNGKGEVSNGAHARADDSIPRSIETDDTPPVQHIPERRAPDKKARRNALPAPEPLERDESGLRMIGSLGRDRAEASGELALGSVKAVRNETQRELVTILPRRITREVPIIPEAVAAQASAEAASQSPAAVTPAGVPPVPAVLAVSTAAPVLPPRLSTPRAGSGVRKATGPGTGAIALLVLAAVLTAIAVFLYLSRGSKKSPSGARSPESPDRVVMQVDPEPAAPDAMMVPQAVDAGVVDVPRAAPDAAVAAPDLKKQAIQLTAQSKAAEDDGDFPRALELANASLKLHRTAPAYLAKARALQRLDHVDDALAAINAAEVLARNAPSVYELRARVLRAARRKDEARVAMEAYLKLVQTGPTAAQFQRWLNEPQ